MGTTSKGNKNQDRARKILEAEGYAVHMAQRTAYRTKTGRWISHSNDVFNAFDIIATKHGEKPLWIQVTEGMNNLPKRREKVDKVPLDLDYNTIQIWVWTGGRKRLDRRYKTKKVYVKAQVFTIFEKTKEGWMKTKELKR